MLVFHMHLLIACLWACTVARSLKKKKSVKRVQWAQYEITSVWFNLALISEGAFCSSEMVKNVAIADRVSPLHSTVKQSAIKHKGISQWHARMWITPLQGLPPKYKVTLLKHQYNVYRKMRKHIIYGYWVSENTQN